jgi:hypothetical protein
MGGGVGKIYNILVRKPGEKNYFGNLYVNRIIILN